MTSKDDKQVTVATKEATIPYRPVGFVVPNGHFYVYKHGYGPEIVERDNPLLPNYPLREGIYSYQLEDLKNGKEVEIAYDVLALSFGLPWTYDKTAGDALKNNPDKYGKNSYTTIVKDEKLELDGKKLAPEDYEFSGIEFKKVTPYGYEKFTEDGTSYLESDHGVIYGEVESGSWGYKALDIKEFPDLNVYAMDRNGSYVKCATVTYSTGKPVIQTENGGTINGTRLTFPKGTIGYKVDAKTKLPAITWVMYPYVKIKPSTKIKAYLNKTYDSDKPASWELANTATMEVPDTGYKKNGFVNEFIGRDRIEKVNYGAKLRNRIEDVSTDKDRSVNNTKLKFTSKGEISNNMLSMEDLKDAIDNGYILEEKSATWYNLLPEGVTPDLNSITLRNADRIEDVKVVPDYRGSGRTMLIVKAKLKPKYNQKKEGFSDEPVIEFTGNYPWTNLTDYGKDLDYRSVYESSNDHLGNRKDFTGERDNPNGENHKESKESVGEFAKLLTDVNPDRNDPSFIYAGSVTHFEIPTISASSITKMVDVNGEGMFWDGLANDTPKNVIEGGNYTYRLTVNPIADTSSKDIVLYDQLESYIPTEDKDDHGDVQWKGTLKSIDLSQMKSKGANPIVYYSTREDLVLDVEDQPAHRDLKDKSIWSTEIPKDKTKITAIAIDVRKNKDGGDFILSPGESISAFINMKAPLAKDLAKKAGNEEKDWYDKPLGSGEKETDHAGGAHAYNNFSLTNKTFIGSQDNLTSQFARYDYTKVGLSPFKIHVFKKWSDDNDRDRKRIAEVEIDLLANGKAVDHIVLSDRNNWKYTFDKLPYADENGEVINYSLKENKIKDYDVSYHTKRVADGLELTAENIHEPEKISISGTKTWENSEHMPKSILLILKADGKVHSRKTVTPDYAGNWKYTFDNLYKYKDGKEIKYDLEEKADGFVVKKTRTSKGIDLHNTWHPYGDITLEKRIKDNVTPVKDVVFTFIFRSLDEKGDIDFQTYDYEKNDGTKGTISNGGRLNLRAGEKITIKNYHTGYKYSFQEENRKGYTLERIYDDQDKLVDNLEGQVKAGATVNAVAVNRYSASGKLLVKGHKELTGRDLEFQKFLFEIKDENGELVSIGNNDRNGNIIFGPINYTEKDRDKTFNYTVSERNTEYPGYTYDKNTYNFKVQVSDNGDGTLNINSNHDDSKIVFKNSYEANGVLNLKAYKILKGGELKDGQFNFELIDKETNKVVSTSTNDAKGVISFNDIKFNTDDVGKTKTLVAREIKGNEANVLYDKTTCEYDITAYDDGRGNLTFKTVTRDMFTGDENNYDTIPLFVNKMKDGSLRIEKRVYSQWNAQSFKFKVKFTGNEKDIPNGDVKLIRGILPDKPNTNPSGSLPFTNLFAKYVEEKMTPRAYQARANEYSVPDPEGSVTDTVTVGGLTGRLYSNGLLEFSPTGSGQGIVDGSKGGIWNWEKNLNGNIKYIRFKGNIKLVDAPSFLESFRSVMGVDMGTTHITGDCSGLFRYCSLLRFVNMEKVNTEGITVTTGMFKGTSIEDLDISNFDMSKVRDNDRQGMLDINGGFLNRISLPVSLKDLSNTGFPPAIYFTRGDYYWVKVGDESKKTKDLSKDYSKTGFGPGGTWILKDFDEIIVKYNPNGGEGSMPNSEGSFKDGVRISGNLFKRLGYLFVGWSRSSGDDNKVEFTEGNLDTNKIGTLPGNELTLYAVWEPIESSVKVTDKMLEFEMNPWESVTIENLPAGLGYEVYEETANGWRLVESSGDIGKIKSNETSVAKFTNSYQNNEYIPVKIRATKFLDGEPAEGFKFVMRYKYPPNNEKPFSAGQLVTSKTNGEIEFPDPYVKGEKKVKPYIEEHINSLNVGESCIENFEIREYSSSKYPHKENIIYDNRKIEVQIKYTKTEKGIVSEVIYPDGTPPTFHNKTKEPPVEKGSLEIKKEVTGDVDPNVEFTFRVITDNINVETFKLKAGQSKVIGDLPVGTNFQVEEVDIPKGYVFEEFSDGNGSKISGSGLINDKARVTIIAKNRHDLRGSFNLKSKKIMEGRTLKENEFLFKVLDPNGNVVSQARNGKNGEINFDAVEITKTGNFTYKIIEANENQPNITYDSEEKLVNVTATVAGNGHIETNVEYQGGEAVFINKYEETPPPEVEKGDFKITKTIDNLTEGNKDKTFNIKVYMKTPAGNPLGGSYTFTSNKSLGGQVESGSGISIKHGETITVTGVPIGTKVAIEEEKTKGYTVSEDSVLKGDITKEQPLNLNLINEYSALGEFSLQGNKLLEGANLNDSQFTFVLTHNGRRIAEAKNDADGNIIFNHIPLSIENVDKVLTYTMYELSGSDENIEYDENSYSVKVKVTDNGEGVLTATPLKNERMPQFVNTFSYELPKTGKAKLSLHLGLGLGLIGGYFVVLLVKKKRGWR